MKTVCSYCAHEFAPKRKNHQYCRQACRQGKYIQRKNGVLPSVSKSKNLSNPSLSQNLSKPSGENIDGINPTPDIVTGNPSAENKPVNDGLMTDQKTPTTNESENKIRQRNLSTHKKSVRRFEVAEDYWQSKSVRKNKTVSTNMVLANPSPLQNVSNPSAENKSANDGFVTDKGTPPTNESENKTHQQKNSTRKKSFRQFKASQYYWKSKSIRKVKTVSNPSAENKPVNDGFVTDQETPPTNESENKTHQQKTSNDELNPSTELCKLPIEKIPPQQPGESIVSYMARFGLTLPVSPGNFTTSLYPHRSDKDKKAFLFVNEKMCEAFKMLFDVNHRRLKPIYLQRVYKRLHEITDGLYFFFTPVDYPFSRFIGLIKFKLGKLIEAAKNLTAFDFELPQTLINQMVLVRLQAKNGGE